MSYRFANEAAFLVHLNARYDRVGTPRDVGQPAQGFQNKEIDVWKVGISDLKRTLKYQVIIPGRPNAGRVLRPGDRQRPEWLDEVFEYVNGLSDFATGYILVTHYDATPRGNYARVVVGVKLGQAPNETLKELVLAVTNDNGVTGHYQVSDELAGLNTTR